MEKDTCSLKVLDSEKIMAVATSSENSENHDDSVHIEELDSPVLRTVPEEANENDREDKRRDEDKTGTFFGLSQSTFIL